MLHNPDRCLKRPSKGKKRYNASTRIVSRSFSISWFCASLFGVDGYQGHIVVLLGSALVFLQFLQEVVADHLGGMTWATEQRALDTFQAKRFALRVAAIGHAVGVEYQGGT